PLNGLNLLLTRTFFSLQRNWVPTATSALNIVVDIAASAALYGPFGVAGLGRLELGAFVATLARLAPAGALLAVVGYGAWALLDGALGRALGAQIVSLGVGLAAGFAVYAASL